MAEQGREWTELQRQHQAWLATPKPERKPRTKTAWAKKLGVDRHTLARWEQLPGWWDAVWEMAGIHVQAQLPEILGALAATATMTGIAPGISAARLLFEVTGRLQPAAPSVTITFTADDLARAAAELEEWERERRPQG
ncbi:MAG: hypothetical protein M5U01_10295 [Ardenticatenaceae bacterium]|nr:hypothetical protein [Ardenticatenaceae bacterium]